MGAQIKFEGLHNVRDLGGTAVADGLKVSSGKMLRSDQLADATETDLAKLGELGIGKIIDLRSAVGRDEKPDPDIAATHGSSRCSHGVKTSARHSSTSTWSSCIGDS